MEVVAHGLSSELFEFQLLCRPNSPPSCLTPEGLSVSAHGPRIFKQTPKQGREKSHNRALLFRYSSRNHLLRAADHDIRASAESDLHESHPTTR